MEQVNNFETFIIAKSKDNKIHYTVMVALELTSFIRVYKDSMSTAERINEQMYRAIQKFNSRFSKVGELFGWQKGIEVFEWSDYDYDYFERGFKKVMASEYTQNLRRIINEPFIIFGTTCDSTDYEECMNAIPCINKIFNLEFK